MPYISTEALVASAFVVVLALGWQYMPKASDGVQAGSGAAAKKKKKARRKGGADSGSAGPDAAGGNAASADPTGQDAATGEAASSGADADQPTSRPKTLAEKLAPKRRKTKVDDMLPVEDRTTSYARVMTIAQPGAAPSAGREPASHDLPGPSRPVAPADSAAPAGKVAKFEADYADDGASDDAPSSTAEEDDGWNVVATKPKKPVSLTIGGSAAPSSSSFAADGQTKIQRKNAKKADAKRAARAADEADRQRRLAMHRRDLEREKINELYSGAGAKGKAAAGGRAKTQQPAQQASVTPSGKLVWD